MGKAETKLLIMVALQVAKYGAPAVIEALISLGKDELTLEDLNGLLIEGSPEDPFS